MSVHYNTMFSSLVPRLPDLFNVYTRNIEKLGVGPGNEANVRVIYVLINS